MAAVGSVAVGSVAVGLVAVGLAPGAALAHPPGQQNGDAPYYRAEITGISPAVAGVTAEVDPGGEWIELRNTGPSTVEVRGYTGEPYLKISSTGVDENQQSQTTYLNRSLFSDSVPTGQAGGSVAPAWKQIATTGAVRWHDHRIHWMGRARPPMVESDPTHPHLVGTWTMHAIADGKPFDVTGALRWLGKPATVKSAPLQSWLLALLAGMTVAVGVLAIALVRARRRPAGGSAAAGPLSAGGVDADASAEQASAAPRTQGESAHAGAKAPEHGEVETLTRAPGQMDARNVVEPRLPG